MDTIEKTGLAGSEKFQIYVPPNPIAYMRVGPINVEVCNKEDVPNRFQRCMQRLILGIEWEIVNK